MAREVAARKESDDVRAAIRTPEDLRDALQRLKGDERVFVPSEARYALYARKSTDENTNKQVRSLDDQITECLELAGRVGIKVAKGDIIRESESAKVSDTRPKFRQLLDDLRSGKYQGILAWHPDRLARNMKEAGEVIDLVDRGTIRDLRFVSFTFENTPSGKLLLGITFALSKEYSDKLSENVLRGNRHSVREGRLINKAKPGYRKDAEQRLYPDGDNFLLVKRAFQMRLDGRTLDEIASYLKANDYHRWNAAHTKKFVKMDKQRVKGILSDPIYTGILNYGTNDVVNLIDLYGFTPMVTVEEFMRINRLSSDAQLVRLANRHYPAESVKADLMRGMVLCAECGEPRTAAITPKKVADGTTTRYLYYRCTNKECPRYGKSIRAKELIEYIVGYLAREPFSSPESYRHYVAELRRVSAERSDDAQRLIASLQARKNAKLDRLGRVKEALLSDDEDTKALFRSELKVVQADIELVTAELEQARSAVAQDKASVPTYEEFVELMEKVRISIAVSKDMAYLDYVIKKIFLNFTVRGKEVVKSSLNSPFDRLETQKVSFGGP